MTDEILTQLAHVALQDFKMALHGFYRDHWNAPSPCADDGGERPTIWVYGSYARHEANEDSDIDVLLVYPGEVQASEEIVRLSPILAEMNLKYQVLISVLPVSQRDFEQMHNPLWTNIRREGVVVDDI